jgi:hypothetical protein
MKKLPSRRFAAITVDLVWFDFRAIKSRPLFNHFVSFTIAVGLGGKIGLTF